MITGVRSTVIARQIGIVLCRVAAAVLTVQAVRSAGYVLPALVARDAEVSSGIVAFALLSVAPGLVAIGLWVFADRISNLIEPLEDANDSQPLSGVDLVRIGTALIGMYLVISAFTYGVSIEVTNLARPKMGDEHRSMMNEHAARTMGNRASYLAELLLGIGLLMGRNKISIMLARARMWGRTTVGN